MQAQDQQEVVTGKRAEVRRDDVLLACRTSLSMIEKYRYMICLCSVGYKEAS